MCRRNLVFPVRPVDKMSKIGMVEKHVSSPKADPEKQIQGKTYFFYYSGASHKEFISPGQTMNAQFYTEVLDRLQK